MQGRIVLAGVTYIVRQKDLTDTTVITVTTNDHRLLFTVISDSHGEDLLVLPDGKIHILTEAPQGSQDLVTDIILEWVS